MYVYVYASYKAGYKVNTSFNWYSIMLRVKAVRSGSFPFNLNCRFLLLHLLPMLW